MIKIKDRIRSKIKGKIRSKNKNKNKTRAKNKKTTQLKKNKLMRVRKKMWDSFLQQNTFQSRKIPILTNVDKLRLYRCGRPIKQSISRGMILMKI